MKKIVLDLTDEEWDLLQTMAAQDQRTPKQQAAWILKAEAMDRGLPVSGKPTKVYVYRLETPGEIH